MLLLKLTDGKVTVKGLEFKPCARLDPDKLPPGSKLIVRNASIKTGIVLLDDKSLQVRTSGMTSGIPYLMMLGRMRMYMQDASWHSTCLWGLYSC